MEPHTSLSTPPPATQTAQQPINPPNQKGMFSGRLNRRGYLMALVYIFSFSLIPILLQLLLRNTGGKNIINIVTVLVGMVGVIVVIPLAISISVRRWHDLNQSGFLVLLNLLPFVGLITLIIHLFLPGTQGINKYGNPDVEPATLRKVLLGQ